ncbi:hypothetical protein CYMTET_29478 [Cymbomonas tetramitiformis]|uniref:EGF-like domain-containing protein n=1 Tax=Cymbomonas tetramitiformis TaxID=36881 RepID=A0AAE0FKX4_9CHLO|nr:hypothetical protein CYMTET_29478 [Cymbomonas tetramitiformis]
MTTLGYRVDSSRCDDLELPAHEEACNADTCPTFHWMTGKWGLCSAACDGGTLVREVKCVSSRGEEAPSETLCTSNKPASTQTCNLSPCVTYTWMVEKWGECSVDCNGGTMNRAVICESSQGIKIEGDWTASSAVSAEEEAFCGSDKPVTTAECNSQLCDFCEGELCSNHGSCYDGRCHCRDEYHGLFCGTPPECEGTLSADGICCAGFFDNHGQCCALNSKLDEKGHCCADDIDVCGQCGGAALLVDVKGVCCTTATDEAGLCCISGSIDGCGVCDGDESTCATSVQMKVSATTVDGLDDTASTSYVSFSNIFTKEIASTLGITTDLIEIREVTPQSSKEKKRRNLLDGADHNRALLQQASASSDLVGVRFDVLPPQIDRSANSKDVMLKASDIEAELVAAVAAGEVASAQRDIVFESLDAVTHSGICGNSICEIGERCNQTQIAVIAAGEDEDDLCCINDCYFVITECPSSGNNILPCSGHGKCVTTAGVCECFSGYTGLDCATCAVGYISEGLQCALVTRAPATPGDVYNTPPSPVRLPSNPTSGTDPSVPSQLWPPPPDGPPLGYNHVCVKLDLDFTCNSMGDYGCAWVEEKHCCKVRLNGFCASPNADAGVYAFETMLMIEDHTSSSLTPQRQDQLKLAVADIIGLQPDRVIILSVDDAGPELVAARATIEDHSQKWHMQRGYNPMGYLWIAKNHLLRFIVAARQRAHRQLVKMGVAVEAQLVFLQAQQQQEE